MGQILIFAAVKMSRGLSYGLIMGCAALLLGAADLLWGGAQGVSGFAVLNIRLPRVLAAVISGAALALGGLQMQSIFRNPLADPHIMGVSAGAGLGAAIALLAGGSSAITAFAGIGMAAAAFAGAAAAGAAICLVSSKMHSAASLLLTGIMISFIANAVTSILQFSSNAEALRMYCNWAAGSIGNCGWQQLCIMGASLAAGYTVALVNTKGLNIMLFGDTYAELSGAGVRGIRFAAIASCCLMAGTVTAFCGPLGFVGIVAPHLARRIAGGGRTCSDHRKTIPLAMLSGAAICLAADLASQLFSRLAGAVPIGSMLAIIGIPAVLAIIAGGDK